MVRKNNRDEFTRTTKSKVRNRAGGVCSNPDCRALTFFYNRAGKCFNNGEVAHIEAAAAGGPRYNEKMTSEERRSENNAIWLCKICASKIDRDVDEYKVERLHEWKREVEKNIWEDRLKECEKKDRVIEEKIFFQRQKVMIDVIKKDNKEKNCDEYAWPYEGNVIEQYKGYFLSMNKLFSCNKNYLQELYLILSKDIFVLLDKYHSNTDKFLHDRECNNIGNKYNVFFMIPRWVYENEKNYMKKYEFIEHNINVLAEIIKEDCYKVLNKSQKNTEDLEIVDYLWVLWLNGLSQLINDNCLDIDVRKKLSCHIIEAYDTYRWQIYGDNPIYNDFKKYVSIDVKGIFSRIKGDCVVSLLEKSYTMFSEEIVQNYYNIINQIDKQVITKEEAERWKKILNLEEAERKNIEIKILKDKKFPEMNRVVEFHTCSKQSEDVIVYTEKCKMIILEILMPFFRNNYYTIYEKSVCEKLNKFVELFD